MQVTLKGTFTITDDVDVESIVRTAIEDNPGDFFTLPSDLDWELDDVEVDA